MMFWCNLVGYQLVWFLLVSGAAHASLWPAMAGGVAFVSWQVLAAPHPAVELRLLIIALLLGVAIDGVLAYTGWLRYASPSPSVPLDGAPVWILMLWACFATTINRSLAMLRSRPWLAALLGAIGAPMAYVAASRGWGAVQFQAESWRALAWIAAGWAIALPVLAILAERWRHPHLMRRS